MINLCFNSYMMYTHGYEVLYNVYILMKKIRTKGGNIPGNIKKFFSEIINMKQN